MTHSSEIIIHDKNSREERTYSFQDIQAIYHELTGNRESMSEFIPSCINLTVEHIEQLNHKIEQWIAQYNCSSLHSAVTIRTVDGQKNVYSDMQRFFLSPNPMSSETLAISIEYNFIILLPNQPTVQNYKLSIQLESNIAKRHKLEQEHLALPKFFIVLSNSVAGQIEIEYVDFNVAASLMTTVKGWSKAISAPKNKSNTNYKKYQRYSGIFPFSFTLITMLIILFATYIGADKIVVPTNIIDTFKNLVLIIVGILVIGTVSYIMGRIAEFSFDNRILISYINLNSHDENLIQQAYSENKQSKRNFITSIIINFIVSICAGIVTAVMMG